MSRPTLVSSHPRYLKSESRRLTSQMLHSMSAVRDSVGSAPRSMSAVQHPMDAAHDSRAADLCSMTAAHDSVSAATRSDSDALDSMGDALPLDGHGRASMAESGRIVPANHRLESATRRSLSGGLDFRCPRTDSLLSDWRILDAFAPLETRGREFEAGDHERATHAHARLSGDRVTEAARACSMTAVPSNWAVTASP
jgi:hypothetical protein